MVRGPAKPIKAFGSAKTTSPKEAKLAATPPMVGLVNTEMNSPPELSSLASAAATYYLLAWLGVLPAIDGSDQGDVGPVVSPGATARADSSPGRSEQDSRGSRKV